MADARVFNMIGAYAQSVRCRMERALKEKKCFQTTVAGFTPELLVVGPGGLLAGQIATVRFRLMDADAMDADAYQIISIISDEPREGQVLFSCVRELHCTEPHLTASVEGVSSVRVVGAVRLEVAFALGSETDLAPGVLYEVNRGSFCMAYKM
jgi:hypothetical protein